MNIELRQGNLFESRSDAIILTVDGGSKGMEGNIARTFARMYPDAWEELEYDIEYPIALGSAKIYSIDPELECHNSHCIVASTLHHIEILENSEKLKVISSALRSSLYLSSQKRLSSVCTAILAGGWRLEIEEALEEMLKTYERAKTTSLEVPQLNIYVLGSTEFDKVETYLKNKYPGIKGTSGIYVI